MRVLARGGGLAAIVLVPVLAFVALLDPGGPLRGTRSPDPLPLPDANAGGLAPLEEMLLEQKLAATPDDDAPLPVGFHDLDFRAPNEDRTTQGTASFLEHAPAEVRELDGRVVRLQGFMIPVAMQDGKVRRGVIVRDQSVCCYGKSPRFCEYVVATIDGDVPPAIDVPMVFTGTMHVGDVVEGDAWSAFYTMDVTAVER